MLIDSLTASLGFDYSTRRLLIDDPSLLGLSDVELAYRWDPTGSEVLLDGISVEARSQSNVVPEPSTFVLFAIGCSALLGRGWRCGKRRHKA